MTKNTKVNNVNCWQGYEPAKSHIMLVGSQNGTARQTSAGPGILKSWITCICFEACFRCFFLEALQLH